MRRARAITFFAAAFALSACSSEAPDGGAEGPGGTGMSTATTPGSSDGVGESTGQGEGSTEATDATTSVNETGSVDETGSSDQGNDVVPEFALLDLNPTSESFEQPVSPRDHLEKVSGWYFTEAT
jgi:hypothetical protein